MKQFYLVVILVFGLQFGFGQIGFEENIIIDNTNYQQGIRSTYTADLDGDNDIDVLIASMFDNTIAWYENLDGQGNYSVQKNITTIASGAISVFAADIDGDGDMDVLSASSSDNTIAWYENLDGLGNFSSQNLISTVAQDARDVHAADIDNDGDIDVLSASFDDDTIAWYENLDGLGNFSGKKTIYSYANGAIDVYTSDIDGDGDLDVLSASWHDGVIAWYENIDGLGNFGGQLIYNFVGNATSIHAEDIDGDGDMDVLSSFNDNSRIAWYENLDGLGNFGGIQYISSYTTSEGASGVYTSDLDGDGDVDVISTSWNSPGGVWYENLDGQGNFGTQQQLGFGGWSVHSDDIDNDGDMDVIGDGIWVENTNANGTFTSPNYIVKIANGAQSVFTADLDGDGDIDVLSASRGDNKIAWYENMNGQITFDSQKVISTQAAGANSVFAVDLDGDGDMDVLSASENDNKIAWYENLDSQGNFSAQQIITTLAYDALSVYAIDLDGDSDVDVLSASEVDDKIAWYENTDGQGSFGIQQVISTNNSNPRSVYATDIDGDGDMDVLSASDQDDIIAWYENMDGQSSFGAQQIITTDANGAWSVYASDIDGDGDMDVLSASAWDDKIAWYENIDGQGTFGVQQIITLDANVANSVYATDIDGDGDMDVLSTGNDAILWYENMDGQGTFSTQQTITANVDDATSVYATDMDGDGDMDVLSTSRLDNKIAWYRNIGLQTNEINGVVRLDMDFNGCDASDSFISSSLISTTDGSQSFSNFSLANGFYQLFPGEGNFTTQIQNLPTYYTSDPVSQTSNFVGLGNTDTIDFCIEPAGVYNDLNISVYPSINDPRPGFDTTYQLVYKNVGTTQLSGSVSFEFDDTKLQFLNASETVTSQTVNTLNFDFTGLNPFETRTIDLEFNVFAPPITNIDDVLVSIATINPVSGDETEEDNTFELIQTVIGSYDPNDITVLEGDEIFIEDADKYLHYLIRFQNTGTASAINVSVEHILDDKLDWTTMQLESLSHTGRVEIENQTDVSFIFNNINLPDSTSDEPNSHGYIAFKIKPKSNVQVGDIISGVADIYFDFNPPIITNTVNTEIVEPLSIDEVSAEIVKLYPNPARNTIQITSSQVIEALTVIDINGRELQTLEILTTDYTLDISNLSKGVYFIELLSGESKFTEKFMKN